MMDTLTEAFKNGTDAAEMYIDSVSGMLEDLAKQMIYSVTLAPIMEEAQNKMTNIMQNAGLSDNQKFEQWANILNGLVDDAINQQNIANNLMAQYKQTAEGYGLDIFKSDGYTQEASSKGFQTMSQDTGDELKGRFTALQMSGEEIRNQITLLNITATDIQRISAEQTDRLASLEDIAANSYIELVGINDNTGVSAKLLKSISDGIDKMNTKLDNL